MLCSGRPIHRYVSVSADISVIGRYIGFADNRNPYRYRLSASADKKANIGSLTDMKICYLFSWFFPNIILSGLEYEGKIYFLLLQEHPIKSSSVRNFFGQLPMPMKITNWGNLPSEQKGKLPSDENKIKNHKGKLPSQKRKFPSVENNKNRVQKNNSKILSRLG